MDAKEEMLHKQLSESKLIFTRTLCAFQIKVNALSYYERSMHVIQKKTNILHNLEIFIKFTPQKLSELEFELTVRIY